MAAVVSRDMGARHTGRISGMPDYGAAVWHIPMRLCGPLVVCVCVFSLGSGFARHGFCFADGIKVKRGRSWLVLIYWEDLL